MKAYYLIGSAVAVVLLLAVFCISGIANCAFRNDKKKEVSSYSNNYMVRYYTDDDDDAEIKYLLVEKGDFVDIKLEDSPYKEFAGFYDSKDYLNANQYVNDRGEGQIAITEDIVLYPAFNTYGVERCEVIIEWQDVVNEKKTRTEYTPVDTVLDVEAANLPTKVGHIFKGLYLGSVQYVDATGKGIKTIDDDITLTAKFERKANIQIVTIVSEEGSTRKAYEVATGERLNVEIADLPLESDGAALCHKAYMGVYDSLGGTEYIDENGDGVVEITEDVTLRVWEAQVITVEVFYDDDDSQIFYSIMDGNFDVELSDLKLDPNKTFRGLYDEHDYKYVDSDGTGCRSISYNYIKLYPMYY